MAVRKVAVLGLLGLAVLAGCSVPTAGISAPALTGTITFSVGQVSSETVDVTASVVDPTTSATLFNQVYLGQTTPFSASYSPASAPVNVTVSVTMHLVPAAALASGSNSTAGTTLTDGSATFSQFLTGGPFFVVDNPTNPTILVDVSSISSQTTLALSASFPAGPYYLYQKQPMTGLITWSSGAGTSYYSYNWDNDTLGGISWNAQL